MITYPHLKTRKTTVSVLLRDAQLLLNKQQKIWAGVYYPLTFFEQNRYGTLAQNWIWRSNCAFCRHTLQCLKTRRKTGNTGGEPWHGVGKGRLVSFAAGLHRCTSGHQWRRATCKRTPLTFGWSDVHRLKLHAATFQRQRRTACHVLSHDNIQSRSKRFTRSTRRHLEITDK